MISTKGRYALRAMIDIACNEKNGFVSLKDISKRQEIPINVKQFPFGENIIRWQNNFFQVNITRFNVFFQRRNVIINDCSWLKIVYLV